MEIVDVPDTLCLHALPRVYSERFMIYEISSELEVAANAVLMHLLCKGATTITNWLGIAFSTGWLSTDDLGQDVGERAQK